MSFSTAFGNLLFRNAFALYRPLYHAFKTRQDRHELSLLKKFIQPGQTILDIGANIGFYAERLSALTGPGGMVHCFEPHPVNFTRLKAAPLPHQNVVLNQLAVADQNGEISFFTSHELNVDHRAYRPEKFEQEIRVRAIRIDDYIRENNVTKVHLVKMDIQGYEMNALKGMTRLIETNPGLVLISEFWPYGLRIAGSSALEYFKALRGLGMQVYLAGGHLTPLSEEKVLALQSLPGKAFYNILATRQRV